MAKGKQTPRQKMINLMYLVFIAMMALNIDVEIIRSFFDTTESLKETRTITENNNNGFFLQTLEAKAKMVPDTYAKPLEQYKVLRNKIDDLVNHVEKVKVKLKKDSKFKELDEKGQEVDVSENYAALNNNEATTSYFFIDGDETKESKEAKELIAKINDVKNYIKTTFGSDSAFKDLVSRSEKALNTANIKNKGVEGSKSWTNKNFYHQPLIAAISRLEILQNDVRNIQSDALAFMLQEKVDAKIKFDNYDAVVKAPTDIVQGTKVEAEVYLVSYTSNVDNVTMTGVSRRDPSGKGYVSMNTGSLGKHTFSGQINVKMSDGQVKPYKFDHTYNVIAGQQEVKYETGAILTADKMNVMYRGLDNPVSGSVLGVDNSTLSLTASSGSVSKTGSGKWVVRPTTGNTITLTLSGSGPRGTARETFTYRIKSVPAPQGQIRNKNMVSMPASSVPKQVLTATIPDFDFPVSFTVTGFKVSVPGRASTYVQGNSLSALSGMVQTLRPGDGVYIFDIEATATGLGGQRLKNISPVLITIL